MKRTFLIVFIIALLGLEFIFVHPHGHGPWWHIWKGSHILLGLAGGLIFIPLIKKAAALFLTRKENYYDL